MAPASFDGLVPNQPTAVILVATSAALSTAAILVPAEVAVVLAVAAVLAAAPVAVQRSGVATPVARVTAAAGAIFGGLWVQLQLFLAAPHRDHWRDDERIIFRNSISYGPAAMGNKVVISGPPEDGAKRLTKLAAAIEQDGEVTRERIKEMLDEARRWFKYLQRQNDQLSGWNRELHRKIDQMRGDALAAEKRARRSSTVSFWAGVALSVPIGILINLATG